MTLTVLSMQKGELFCLSPHTFSWRTRKESVCDVFVYLASRKMIIFPDTDVAPTDRSLRFKYLKTKQIP